MIIGVYGLWAFPTVNNISTYIKRLTKIGCKAKEFRYARFMIFHTYLLAKIFRTERRLFKQLVDGDSIIAHSFGGVLALDLVNMMHQVDSKKKLKNIYLFNPSADADIVINDSHFEKMYIFHNPNDKLLELAKLLPFNRLGALGQHGYRHKSKKIVNICLDELKEPSYTRHADAMKELNLTKYSEFIKERERDV